MLILENLKCHGKTMGSQFLGLACLIGLYNHFYYKFFFNAKRAQEKYNKSFNEISHKNQKEYDKDLNCFKADVYSAIDRKCKYDRNITFVYFPVDRFRRIDEIKFAEELRHKGFKVDVNFGEFKVSW
jgi:tRNA G26 N,N-dimethylase Trm1